MSGHTRPLKRLSDGRALLNVACGFYTHPDWNNVDFSAYSRLAQHPRLARLLRTIGILSPARFERLSAIDPDIVVRDLRRGIPFPDASLSVVYHSHFLEHIPADAAEGVLVECRRVLEPGGILRVVVPDLHTLATRYVAAFDAVAAGDTAAWQVYDRTLYDLFDQMVRSEPFAVRQQKPLVRAIERVVRGNAAKAGETHLWMYDEQSMRRLLASAGFRDVTRHAATTSGIAGWSEFALDADAAGTPHKPDSLYIEAVK